MYIHVSQKSYAWHNKSSLSRIDYWLVSKQLKNVLTDILPSPLCDHKTISINIPFLSSPSSAKSSYWKLSTLLKYKDVTSEIERLIGQYWNKALLENVYSNHCELMKYEIAKYLRKYSGDLAKIKAEENGTILMITSLSSRPLEALSESENIECNEQLHRLDEIYKRKAEGAFVRSHRSWLEEGEQNSAYFFRLEKQQAKNNTIQQMKMDGLISED